MTGIRDARLAAAATQNDAAEILGKTQSHYSKIERGAVELNARDALKLCRAWDVTLSQLLTSDRESR